MKYFTKQWFEENQLSNYLFFLVTMGDWEEEKAYYREYGIDLEQERKMELQRDRDKLLKFLPKEFHPYVLDGSIIEGSPSDKLRSLARNWLEHFDTLTNEKFESCAADFIAAKSKLSKTVSDLFDSSFHDAIIQTIERNADQTCTIKLNLENTYHEMDMLTITFIGVSEFTSTAPVRNGSWWLYEEISIVEGGFRLSVLFDSPLAEFSIVAKDVVIESK
ncbi:DUF4085 family protein [Viridibacillus arvi]|jgi:hypothetical protein|uniref:DUF4085 domain-containing protein n=1 Tax=Viridibacillus arvi TaxID=263475 RepID=A0A0M0LKF2_9BACL|nr:DUF4085 family protein [Viridibacillus arvi]KOO51514.1 hypothetical protein AMD00_03315 [Viridibacillus arvi]